MDPLPWAETAAGTRAKIRNETTNAATALIGRWTGMAVQRAKGPSGSPARDRMLECPHVRSLSRCNHDRDAQLGPMLDATDSHDSRADRDAVPGHPGAHPTSGHSIRRELRRGGAGADDVGPA